MKSPPATHTAQHLYITTKLENRPGFSALLPQDDSSETEIITVYFLKMSVSLMLMSRWALPGTLA
jgi:hypothetical protein